MKLIYRIAKLELSTLFYSPIAWIILIIFTLQAGFVFTGLLDNYLNYILRGYQYGSLTDRIFSTDDTGTSWIEVKNNLYLYLPLLTMGLISRERSSGSIKLLFSSPVSVQQIVWGKFLGIMGYCCVLSFILVSLVIVGGLCIRNFEYPQALCGVLGLFLLMCAYSAIGLFISSLTSYQVVAAVGTIAVLAILKFIGALWQTVPLVKDVTYWLSIAGRVDVFLKGIISSKELIYFIIVTVLFVYATIAKLSDEKIDRSLPSKVTRYALLVCLAVAFGYTSSKPFVIKYFDTSRGDKLTLTKPSQHIVKQLPDKLILDNYVNLFDGDMSTYWLLPESQNKDIKYFEQYLRFKPDFEMGEYVYFYDTVPNNVALYNANEGLSENELAEKVAFSFSFDFKELLSPTEIKKRIDLRSEENQVVRQFRYEGKTSFLRMYDDPPFYPTEAETTSALKRLIATPPLVAFVTGHNERNFNNDEKNYGLSTIAKVQFRESLCNKGFDLISLSLQDDEIPEEVAVLVIADPKSEFSDLELIKIKSYVESGRNLLIAAEPATRSFLQPITSMLGVNFLPGQLHQESEKYDPEYVFGKFTNQTSRLLKSHLYDLRECKDCVTPMPTSMGLAYEQRTSGFTYTPIVTANKRDTWNDVSYGKLVRSEEKSGTNSKEAIPIALGVSRKVDNKDQKIFVVGDADFMSNAVLTAHGGASVFYLWIFAWFTNHEYPIDFYRPNEPDLTFTIGRRGALWLKILLLGITPTLFAVLGGVLLFKRKRS